MTWPFPYDAPSTLAGQLQRGLGRGFLAALDAPHDDVHAILLDCILHEARLDHQIDSRGWYYGELAYRTGLAVEPLDGHLRAAGEDEAGDGWPALDVLGHLAMRGREDAVDALRKYVEFGGWWEDALQELGRANRPERWSGLENIAVTRLAGAEPRVGVGSDAEPFATWSRTVPAFIAWREAHVDTSRESEAELERLRYSETASLLMPPLSRIHERANILAGRTSGQDVRSLALALRHDDALVRALASYALAQQGSTAGLEAARDILLRLRGRRDLLVRNFATRALIAMPSAPVLPLAREWRSSRRFALRYAARQVLARHGDRDDVPWLRRQLERQCIMNAEYELSAAAELARRLWHPAMLADLFRLFSEFRSSSLRPRIAETLAEMDPSFPATLAVECLWDCEADTRLLGVTRAGRSNDLVAARIAEIATDSAEDVALRIAARDALR